MSETIPGNLVEQMNANIAALDSEFDSKESTAQAPPVAETKPEEVKTDDAAPAPTAEVSSQPSTPTYTKDYQDWLNKYGGDREKADRAIWETNNRNAALAKELEELKKAPPAPTAEAKPEPIPTEIVPEDVKRLDESLRAIEADYENVRTEHSKAIARKQELQATISDLQRKITFEDLDFEGMETARKELKRSIGNLEALEAYIEKKADRAFVLASQFDTKKTQRDQYVALSELRAAREAEITEREQHKVNTEIENFGRTFLSSIPEVAKEGDPIPPELMAQWDKYARKESHLRLNVEDLPTTEVRSFLTTLKKDFLAEIDQAHRAMAARYAARKTADAEVSAPEGAAAVAKTVKTRGFTSQQEVEAFIERNANF